MTPAANDYTRFLQELTARIRSAQYEALKAVYREIDRALWGHRQTYRRTAGRSGLGKSVVETRSRDIQKEFPGIRGFGVANMWDIH